jgi:uncharacterized membrane protein
MDLYGLLLFVHVFAAATWVGGALMFYVLAESAYGSRDRSTVAGILRLSEKLGMNFFIPFSLLAVIAGILLVIDGAWGWTEPFVLGGLVGVVLTTIVGAVFGTGAEKAVLTALENPETTEAELGSAVARMKVFARLDMALLIIVVFLMTAKPGT